MHINFKALEAAGFEIHEGKGSIDIHPRNPVQLNTTSIQESMAETGCSHAQIDAVCNSIYMDISSFEILNAINRTSER